MRLLFLFFFSTCFASFQSQCGQDRYVYEHFFPLLKEGIFVDIGAHDGVSLSNTYFFEKALGWKGICIEPIPEVFAELKKNRNAACIQGCISTSLGKKEFLRIQGKTEMLSGLIDAYDPKHVERIQREIALEHDSTQTILVDCYLFNDLMQMHGIEKINFLSLDTEGGELEILQSIDFSRFEIDVIAVENNYNDPRFAVFLESRGFQLFTRLEQDMIFLNKKFYK